MICCTSDVNPPIRFRGYDEPEEEQGNPSIFILCGRA